MPGTGAIGPTAPPAYEDIDNPSLVPSAPPFSSTSLSIPSGIPPPVFSSDGQENTLHQSSAAPHLPGFPRVHSLRRGNADDDSQPPPYQVAELSVTQLDETEEARRLEIERDVEELRRRREERDRRLEEERERRLRLQRDGERSAFWTGVTTGATGTSFNHCHRHNHCKENGQGSEGAAVGLCVACVFCGVIGCFVMGFFLCRRGCGAPRRDRSQEEDRCYRILCILGGIFFMLILPAGCITGLIIFFQKNPDFFNNINLGGGGYTTKSPWSWDYGK